MQAVLHFICLLVYQILFSAKRPNTFPKTARSRPRFKGRDIAAKYPTPFFDGGESPPFLSPEGTPEVDNLHSVSIEEEGERCLQDMFNGMHRNKPSVSFCSSVSFIKGGHSDLFSVRSTPMLPQWYVKDPVILPKVQEASST